MSVPTPERREVTPLEQARLVRAAVDQTVLDFITATMEARGYPPTVREVGEHMGWTSSSTVANRLARLKREGRVTSKPGSPRTLVVVR